MTFNLKFLLENNIILHYYIIYLFTFSVLQYLLHNQHNKIQILYKVLIAIYKKNFVYYYRLMFTSNY